MSLPCTRKSKYLTSLTVGSALLTALSSTAMAEESSETTLDTLVISDTFSSEEGVNATDSTSTKMNISLKDTTRSVVQVSEEEIGDMSAQDIKDVATYQTGFNWSETNSRYIYNRGIQGNVGDSTINGLRSLTGSGPTNSSNIPSTYNLDSVTFLNGADSLLYGSGVSGGLISLTTKKPQEESETTLGISTRSYLADDVGYFDRNQAIIDIDSTGKLNESGDVLYRVITRLTPDGEDFQDNNSDNDKFIDASLTFKAGDQTTITPRFEYKKQEHTGGTGWSRGQFTDSYFDGSLETTAYFDEISDRSLYIGGLSDYYNTESTTIEVSLKHLLENGWSLNAKAAVVEEEINSAGLWASTSDYDIGDTVVSRKWYYSESYYDYLLADANAEGKFSLGETEHHLIAGVNFRQKTRDSDVIRGSSTTDYDIDLTTLDQEYYDVPDSILSSVELEETVERDINIYLKDRMTINRWTLGLGLGYLDFYGEESDGEFKQGQQHLSYDAAVLYKLNQDMNLFASYSQTYNPVDTSTIVEYGEDGVDYVPEESDNYEFGVKGNFLNGRLNASANVFYINTKNESETVDTDGDTVNDSIEQILGEKFRSHGIDISALYHFTDQFSTQVNYTYTDAHDTKGDQEGVQADLTPYHQLTVWNNYSLESLPLRLALGMRSSSKTPKYSSTLGLDSNIPGYAEFDVGAYYETEKWDASLTITNLLDNNRVGTVANGWTYTAADPRAINFGIKYRL